MGCRAAARAAPSRAADSIISCRGAARGKSSKGAGMWSSVWCACRVRAPAAAAGAGCLQRMRQGRQQAAGGGAQTIPTTIKSTHTFPPTRTFSTVR